MYFIGLTLEVWKYFFKGESWKLIVERDIHFFTLFFSFKILITFAYVLLSNFREKKLFNGLIIAS